VHKLPHKRRELDEVEEIEQREAKRTRTACEEPSIIVIEELSSPAAGRYTIESDDDDSWQYVDRDFGDQMQVNDDTDEEDENMRLIEESERLLESIDIKINNIIDSIAPVNYDADTEDF